MEFPLDTMFRYFHILAGITWIGLLYFFNLVNLPLLKFDMKKPFTVDMAEKASLNITMKTLWWFRWGAAFTVLFGLLLMETQRQEHGSMAAWMFERGFAGYSILLGVLFGLVMAFNVWFIIWPAQQTILGNNKKIADGVSDDEKKAMTAENAPLVKKAVFASRMNTWLSIPMLFGMVFGAHGTEVALTDASALGPIAVLAAVLVAMVVMSKRS